VPNRCALDRGIYSSFFVKINLSSSTRKYFLSSPLLQPPSTIIPSIGVGHSYSICSTKQYHNAPALLYCITSKGASFPVLILRDPDHDSSLSLLKRCNTVFMKLLSVWMQQGMLLDNTGEFFVVPHKEPENALEGSSSTTKERYSSIYWSV